MKINEMFYSIQGEGKWMGLPNIFIRTTGCNLRCSFCDTTYAYKKGDEKSIETIEKEIKKYNCKYVCVTGGEPLIQDETVQLIDVLLKDGYKICLETNGSIDIKNFVRKKNLLISIDIKCPSSNMHEKMFFKNISQITSSDQLKFVIQDIIDYKHAKKIVKKYKTQSTIYFQPVWGVHMRELASWILKDGLDVRIGLQMHKIIWGDIKGV